MKTPALVLTALSLLSASQAFGFGAGSNTFATATSANDGTQKFGATNLTAFTAEAGEPGHRPSGSNGALKTAWWTYQPAVSGYLTISTYLASGDSNGVRDTVLSVYTGLTVNTLTRVASNDDFGNGFLEAQTSLSKVSFYAQAGTIYRIAVDGFDGSAITASLYNVRLTIRHLPLSIRTRFGSVTFDSGAADTGSLTYTTTATSSFSGKFNLGGKVTAFTGFFSHDGYATVIIPRPVAKGAPPLLPYTLIIDGAIGGKAYFYTTEMDGYSVTMYETFVFTKDNPNPLVGYYTGVLDFAANAAHGSITATFKATGNATGTMLMADGTTVIYSSPFYSAPGLAPRFLQIYQPLFTNQGYLYGLFYAQENGAVDSLTGTLVYSRPAAKPGVPFYPGGLLDSASVEGGTYNKPAANERALSFLSAFNGVGNLFLFDEGGELGGDITESLTFTVTNKFVFNSLTRKPVLTLNTATGLVTGSITAPPLKKRTIKGVLYRFGGGAYLRGHVTGTAKNLEIEVGL